MLKANSNENGLASSSLPPVHGGGGLRDLCKEHSGFLMHAAYEVLPRWTLSQMEQCDLELLMNGAFSPLCGFMGPEDYASVCSRYRLADGLLWPIPILLRATLDKIEGRGCVSGSQIALCDYRDSSTILAIMKVEHTFSVDVMKEALQVYGSTDTSHPSVASLSAYAEQKRTWAIGGPIIHAIRLPQYDDFTHLRKTPGETRAEFTRRNWNNVVAFQTRNPMHRAHKELVVRAAKQTGAKILIHPVVGMTKPGDIDYITRVKVYEAILQQFSGTEATLALLPLAMRMGGPREALWHMIIRQNFGCRTLIVGRDHSGPGNSRLTGLPYYGLYEAQEFVAANEKELYIKSLPFAAMVYVKNEERYIEESEISEGMQIASISGTQLREMLHKNLPLPKWFTYPEVAEILKHKP